MLYVTNEEVYYITKRLLVLTPVISGNLEGDYIWGPYGTQKDGSYLLFSEDNTGWIEVVKSVYSIGKLKREYTLYWREDKERRYPIATRKG